MAPQMERDKFANDMDEQIDAALRAVGHAIPAPGLAERISLRLESAPAKNSIRRFSWQRVLVPAFGCMAVAVFVLVAVRMRVAPVSAMHPLQERQHAIATAVAPKEIAAPRNAEVRSPAKHVHARTMQVSRRVRHMYPDNYPLTHQERLLVQLVQTVNPAELQILNPEYRAAQQAKEDAEFEAYVKSAEISATNTKTQSTNEAQTTEEGSTL